MMPKPDYFKPVFKKLPLYAVIFFCSLLVCSCTDRKQHRNPASAASGVPAYGDAIVVAGIGDARTLVPILASDSASGDICGMIFNGLVKYDKNLKLVGDLAKSWDILDNGLVIVFHLRHGVKWQDGVEFTAADVEFTYRKLIDPKVPTPYSGDFKKVKSFEVLDKYTVKITYAEPFAPALASWGIGIMPKHLLEHKDLTKTAFARHPVGTGPYILKKWKTQEEIVLEANHDYFGGRPYIERYIYRIIPDPATMFLELQDLGVDWMGLTPLQYIRQTDTPFFKKNFRKFRYPGSSYTYMGYNLKDPMFSDIRVRQAINYAVNKKDIIQGVLLGLGQECTGPFMPRSWAFNKNVKPVPVNMAKARKLLQEAGWTLNKKGLLEKNGKIFEFTIITNQGNEERKRTAEIIQRQLLSLGMKVKIKVVEWSAFINEFINKKNFEAVLLGWQMSNDPDIYDIWDSSQTKEGGFNFISYNNKEVDKLLELARREFDVKIRAKYYHRVQQIIYNEQPYLFLYYPDSLPIINRRFKGIKPAPAGIGYNFIKWYVPAGEKRYTQ